MFTISGNNISMINKDTATIDIAIEGYTFVSGDIAYFTVKKSVDDNVNLIHKKVTEFDGNVVTFFLSTDETNLEPNKYVYDVQLSLADGRVDTVIGPADFVITKGVTEV